MYNIKLNELIEYCEKHKFETRYIIIPNSSGDSNILIGELDKRNIPYSLDKRKNPPEEIFEDCYVIDFRQINLIK